MKRRVALSLIVSFLGVATGCGHGAKTTKIVERRPIAVVVEPNGPLLWQVDGPNGPVFLYGTIHTGGRALVPQVAFDKLATTKTFVMEMDIENVPKMALVKRAMLSGDQSLEDMLGAADWQKLVAGVGGMAPEAALRRFKPWFAAMLLIQAILGQDNEATDKALLDDAKQAGQALAYLETWEVQIDAVEKALDLAALKEMLGDLDKQKVQLEELVAAYRVGDATQIAARTIGEMTPAAFDAMIKQRNERWMPTIVQHIGAGNVFVAVGAGHLVGPDGVVTMLREQGYTVTRVAP